MNERATQMRDLLNNLIALQSGTDIESEIVRCSLACAVEELEKFMYGGSMTPSVKPVIQPIPLTVPMVQVSQSNLQDIVENAKNIKEVQSLLTIEERLRVLKNELDFAVSSIIQRTGCDGVFARSMIEKFTQLCVRPTPEEKELWNKMHPNNINAVKISYIKWLRERTGVGLKDAKDYVDAHGV